MRRLGQWSTVYPNTPVFVPEQLCIDIPRGAIILPLEEYTHTCAVMGKPDADGMRTCVGWTMMHSIHNNHANLMHTHERNTIAVSKCTRIHTLEEMCRCALRSVASTVFTVCYWVGGLPLS